MLQRALVVDDEAAIARLVEINLKRAGYEVSIARDGVEALEKVRDQRPDIIICDVMMPRLDGIQVLRQLKADAATRDIPVIMLTAKSQHEDILNGWQSGTEMYLTKPFSPPELLMFVRRLTRPSTAADDGRIRI
jgi:DNA-binding response OmpR family regulator